MQCLTFSFFLKECHAMFDIFLFFLKNVMQCMLTGTVGIGGVKSDPLILEWHVRFSIVPLQPLSDQGQLRYHYSFD